LGWHAHLRLDYRRDGDRTLAHDRHEGPLRVLQRLYPEGPGVCHHVLVHPPGGIVGGDVLNLDLQLAEGSHALLTTPGATRFYRSAGPLAAQRVQAQVANGARLEWLPLETIAYRGCRAENHFRFSLAPQAQMMGWDLLALGLPAAGDAFDADTSGEITQHLELPGVWLERGRIAAADHALLHGPLGLAGRPVMATLWFAAGSELARELRERLLDGAREALGGGEPGGTAPTALLAGASAPNEQTVVMRVLAPQVEPAMALLVATWQRWRQAAWAMPPCPPRVWRT
jgi:urease accessory protein